MNPAYSSSSKSLISDSRENSLRKIRQLFELIGQDLSIGRIKDSCESVAESIVKDDSTFFDVCIVRIVCGEEMRVFAFYTSPNIHPKPKGYNPRSIYNKGFTGEVYRYKKVIEINKIDEHINNFLSKQWIVDYKLKSFFCFPLIAKNKNIGDESIGVISIFTTNEYYLKDSDREFINRISLLFDEYIHVLQEAIQKEYNPAPKSKTMQKVDSFLIHEFKVRIEKLKSQGNYDDNIPIILPIIVEVKDSLWKAEKIPDFEELYRSGNAIICNGSLQSVEALNNEKVVICIEASNTDITDVY
jgi:hypothetical protein